MRHTHNLEDILTVEEGESAQRFMGDLSSVPWAKGLLRDIEDNGGICRANKGRLFELRFGHALHTAGIVADYEVPGEASSALDFGFTYSSQAWLVELMRLGETVAARDAMMGLGEYAEATNQVCSYIQNVKDIGIQDVKELNNISIQSLSSPDWQSRSEKTLDESGRSEEGETLKAIQRICEKCVHDGKAHKFRLPRYTNSYHVLMVDCRTFLTGVDRYDAIQIGLGSEFIPEPHLGRYWKKKPITGVFHPRTHVRGAEHARARVHFLGFVSEQSYGLGELPEATILIANPALFSNAEEARAAISSWPLQPATVLRAGAT